MSKECVLEKKEKTDSQKTSYSSALREMEKWPTWKKRIYNSDYASTHSIKLIIDIKEES